MGKKTGLHKKRTVARRKKRRLRRRNRSLQKRLARMAKTKQSLATLLEALKKFPPGAIGVAEPDPQERHRRSRLDKPLLDVSIQSRDYPEYFRLGQSPVQQKLSVTVRMSFPQWLTRTLWVESAVPHGEAAVLWVLSRHWPLAIIGYLMQPPEITPIVLTHARRLLRSPTSPSFLFAVTRPTLRWSIALEQSPGKLFYQDGLLTPHLSSNSSAVRLRGAYRTDPTVAVNPALITVNLTGVEQSTFKNKKKFTKPYGMPLKKRIFT